MNEAKRNIDDLMGNLSAAQAVMSPGSTDEESSADTSGEVAKMAAELKAAKKKYREAFASLDQCKDELNYMQREKELHMQNLLQGFETWSAR